MNKYNPILDDNYNGCLPNPKDARDIVFGDIPEVFKADPSAPSWEQGYSVEKTFGKLKREHQGSSSSCVGQGWSKYLEMLELVENKKITDLSAKFVYRQIFQSNGGAYIRDGAKLAVGQGDCEEKLCLSYDNGKNPSEEFMRSGNIIQSMKDNALTFQSKKFVNLPVSFPLTNEDWENMKQLIWQYHGFVAGYSGHCQYFCKYGLTPEGKKYVGTIGSYGEGSDMQYSEFIVNRGARIFDITSLVDLPNPPNKINRPKYIEKVVKTKDDPKCWVIYCGMKFEIVGNKIMDLLGLSFSEVQEISEHEFNGYALASPITEDRIDTFKEFFNLSPAEWKIKYSPKPIDKVVGVFQFLIEVISELFGKIKFGGNIEFLGRHRLGYNCVLYARSHYPNLPEGLWNLRQKRAIINSSTPQVGCVAIMNTGWIGHCGIVESFMGDQSNPGEITIVEANYKRGYISRRTGRPADLKLIGYFT